MTPFKQTHWGKLGWGAVAVALLCLAVVIVLVFNQVLESDQGPMEPTPAPTLEPTIGPTLESTPATPATPMITFDPNPAPARGSLLELLEFAPDRLEEGSLPLSDIAQYADIQRWMELRGVETPTNANEDGWTAWQFELQALAIPDVIATRGVDPVWMETYGFGLNDVDQLVAVGSAPDYVLIFRGDFSADTMHASWVESGYQAVRVDGLTIWSLYPGDSVDLSAPASRPALGNLNNLLLLDDGTLIATSRLSRMQQTVGVIHGQAPALAENDAVQRMLASGTNPEQLVTAVLQKGSVLEALPLATPVAVPSEDIPGATPISAAEIPQGRLMLTGLQVHGETERVAMVLIVSYPNAEDATIAMARAERELARGTSAITGEPFAERVVPARMRVIATDTDESLLLIQLHARNGYDDWRPMLEQRDFGYIMWPREP